MDFQKVMEELRENTRELEKQYRLKTLRRILSFLLIGLLMRRDFDKRISELVTRNDLILKSVLRRFEEHEVLRRHKREVGGSVAYSGLTDERKYVANLAVFKGVLSSLMASKATVRSSALLDNAVLHRYEQTILNLAKEFVNQREEEIREQIKEIEDSGTYLVHDDKERVIGVLKAFEEALSVLEAKSVLDEEFVSGVKSELERFRQFVLNYNREFVERRKREYGFLFVKDGLSLDEEQKEAVVKDDKHNLVVAAAGSGKTEVLITRVAYLIKRKPDAVQPDRILAIAFQDKARREIEQRLRSRYGISDVNVRTFHKLGKDIWEKAGWRIRHTDIVDENKFEMVKKIYESKLKSEPDFYDAFLRYVRSFRDVEEKADFEDKERALRYKKTLRYVAINGVRVNSRAEKEILDFFLMHKLNGNAVEVEYEPDVDGFRPDFWLSEFDLFVEHWALDEKGDVPEWFGQSSEDYKKNMRRKKEWFDKNGKLLVETFAYEYDEENPDRFVDLLKQRVIEKLQSKYGESFEFIPLSYGEVVEVAWGPYRDPVANDILNFIRNAK
ncbi:MAG: UvrD-helicase domain-containing protein, partial [Candidatus Bathyarchaeota archaeon]|nr:UvrD-helicase domain-containing protein [Candidatus Bathyarchaeota archaeon]